MLGGTLCSHGLTFGGVVCHLRDDFQKPVARRALMEINMLPLIAYIISYFVFKHKKRSNAMLRVKIP